MMQFLQCFIVSIDFCHRTENENHCCVSYSGIAACQKCDIIAILKNPYWRKASLWGRTRLGELFWKGKKE